VDLRNDGHTRAMPTRRVGVEEEPLLIDPETGGVVPRAADVLPHGAFAAELMREMVEEHTPPLVSLFDLRDSLVASRRLATEAAAREGISVAACPQPDGGALDQRRWPLPRDDGQPRLHRPRASRSSPAIRVWPSSTESARGCPFLSRSRATPRSGRARTPATPPIAGGCGDGGRWQAPPSSSALSSATRPVAGESMRGFPPVLECGLRPSDDEAPMLPEEDRENTSSTPAQSGDLLGRVHGHAVRQT